MERWTDANFEKAVLIIAGMMVIGAMLVVAGLTAAAVKVWPASRTWVREITSRQQLPVTAALEQLAGRVGSGPLRQLITIGVNPATLASVAAKPELAVLLNAVAAAPEFGVLLRDGTYQEAIREAIRQNAQSIVQVQLDQAASPQTRAVIARVQEVLGKEPLSGATAASVNLPMLDLLQTPAFAGLMQDSKFSAYLAGPKASSELD